LRIYVSPHPALRLFLAALTVVAVPTWGGWSDELTLAVGSSTVRERATGAIPIELVRGTSTPASIFLDILYDPAELSPVGVEQGAAAIAASKDVSYDIPSSGRLKVIVGGINENVIDDGTLMEVTFRLSGAADEGDIIELRGAEGSAADLDAQRIDVNFTDGAITVEPGEPIEGAPVDGTVTLLALASTIIAVAGLSRRKRVTLGIVLLVTLTPSASGVVVAGDIDLSGVVDTSDIAQFVVDTLSCAGSYRTDVDQSGVTDAVDYQLIVRALLGHDIDSDDDGLADAAETNIGTGVNDADSDDDGLTDGDEVNAYGTDPLDTDSDDDGLTDQQEVDTHGTDPLDDDSDNDGLTDHAEVVAHGTDPTNPDTDGDYVNDGEEVAMGEDPTVPTTYVWINEFVASNGSGLQDEDGLYWDWIELYNPAPVPVDLTGWALTDDPDEPDKWVFPAVSIAPEGYLVVYASGLDRTPTDGGNLHTNFRLDADGEDILLFGTDGSGYVDSTTFDMQVRDVSFGRFPDGGMLEWRFYEPPSPGAPNTGGYLGRVAAMEFSVDHGVYSDPVAVEISTGTPDAEIYYTLDGSDPTPSSNLYGGPVPIAGTTVLRARAYRTGWLPTDIDARTYIYLDDTINQPALPVGFPATWGGPPSSNDLINGDYEMDPEVVTDPAYVDSLTDALTQIPSISLSMHVDEWFGRETGIISNSALNDEPGWERACSAELIYPDGHDGFSINCGVRVAGGTSANRRFKVPKHSLRLKFNDSYGPTRLKVDEPLVPGSRQMSFNTLVLDARLNMTWYHSFSTYQREHAQYLRDQFINDMQNLLGDLSPHGFYAHVYINGLYWGMYCVHERPDDAFMSDYLGGEPEEYDVVKHKIGEVVAGSNSDLKNMFALARSGMADQAAFETLIDQYLDLTPFTNYMLLNFWAGNTDWARHNWYVGRNRNDGSLFRYYSWDAEHVLKELGHNVTNDNMSGAPTELHQLLKQNTTYRIQFADRAHKLLKNGGLFTQGPAREAYSVRADEVYDAVIMESARWGDHRRDHRDDSSAELYTRDGWWIPELNRIRDDYMANRAEIVIGQLRDEGLYPAVEAPVYNIDGAYKHGGVISSGAVLTMDNPNGSGAIYYTLDGSDPLVPTVGAVSPTARDYSADPPGPLTDTTRVRSRVLSGSDWSALNDAVYQLDSAEYGALRITEVMYNPADPDVPNYWDNDDFEFIEIKNTGGYTLDLTGVSLDDGVYYAFNDSTVRDPHLLAPGQYVVVVRNEIAFRSRYGDGIYVAGRYQGSLANAGERIRMADPAGDPIIEFEYNDAWFQITDGDGFSLTAMDEDCADPAVWDSKDGWRPGSVIGGTPGAVDVPTVPAPGAVVINEVLSHSHAAPDWIELHNTTGTAINIGEWFLSDTDTDLTRYEIPPGTSIPAGGYAMFYEDTHFGPPNPRTPFALSENGETLYLSSGFAGELTGYSEEEEFGAAETGVAFGRYFKASTGTYDFVAMSVNTPGLPNAAPKVGPIVISEIMYHPEEPPTGDPDAEYIELYNIEPTPVTLQDVTTGATWRLTDGVEFTFPPGTAIPANGRLLVVLDLAAFAAEYPGVSVQVLEWDSGRLNNAGERVELGKPGDVDDAGRRQYIRVDRVNYDDVAPWPTSADGSGDALDRNVLSDYGNDVANWQAAAPTPGE